MSYKKLDLSLSNNSKKNKNKKKNANNNNNARNTFRPPRLLEDPVVEGRQLNDERTFATAPLSSNPVPSIELTSSENIAGETVSRARREISEGDENEINKKFFKHQVLGPMF